MKHGIEKVSYFPVLRELKHNYSLVDPCDEMCRVARERSLDALYQSNGHYTALANQIVGEALAQSFSSTDVKND